MAGELSLKDLEDAERVAQHRIDLLNQADQALHQESDELDAFLARHPDLQSHGHLIADAIKNIETILTRLVTDHNALVAKIGELKQQAHDQQQADPGY